MSAFAFVLPGFSRHPVGGFKVVYQYANELVALGEAVTIYHMRPGHLRDAALPLSRRLAISAAYAISPTRRPGWFDLDERVAVRNLPRQRADAIEPADVLVATSAETADVVAAAAAASHARGVYFIQHYESWTQSEEFIDRTWRLPLKKIVIAPWLQDRGREIGVESTVVANAIDSTEFPGGPPIDERPLQVMAMVSSTPWKRTDLVVAAMTQIASELSEAELRTFGTCERPDDLPAQARHIKEPSAAELVHLYQNSRVYLCASDAEGWHLPPAEAMCSGAAVVSTDIGGVRSYGDGIALFSPPGDATALATNALRLLSDPHECRRLAAMGQHRITSYSLAQAAAAFRTAALSD